jgi:hypothetical protein
MSIMGGSYMRRLTNRRKARISREFGNSRPSMGSYALTSVGSGAILALDFPLLPYH